MATKLTRSERTLSELTEQVKRRHDPATTTADEPVRALEGRRPESR